MVHRWFQMFEFRAIHNENKTLKSVTRVRVVDEKAKLDSVRRIHLNLKYLVTLFSFCLLNVMARNSNIWNYLCTIIYAGNRYCNPILVWNGWKSIIWNIICENQANLGKFLIKADWTKKRSIRAFATRAKKTDLIHVC